ncbi:MAG: biotin transporter BioY [Ruminococcaceae bacterium]|nr:biotin transporter BioY [Oscillospiraceae bacterium]
MSNRKIKDIVLISLFSAIIVVCSFITIPSAIPFTLQTFAVFLCLNILGAKKGIISILIYIFIGVVGLPVFSGFNGGIGALLNVTGGYIVGFIFSALIFWVITSVFNKKSRKIINLIASFMGLIVCYIFGTLWYILLFIKNGDTISFTGALTICVLPFIIPDILKIVLSVVISEKINKFITKN